jgi:hypothetical protein
MEQQMEKHMVIRIYPNRDPETRIVVEDEHGNPARQEDMTHEDPHNLDPLRHIAEHHEKLIGGIHTLIVIVEDNGTRSVCFPVNNRWDTVGQEQ